MSRNEATAPRYHDCQSCKGSGCGAQMTGCATCNGHGLIGGFVGGGAPGYESYPCHDCTPLGLVERLRNGGQTDLADMAQRLVDALKAVEIIGYEHRDDESAGELAERLYEARCIARAAINSVNGAQA